MTPSTILGPDGQPIQKKQLVEGIDDAQLTGTRNMWSHGSIASGLSPVRLATVLEAAADGRPNDFFTLAEEIEERDLHYACELSKRKLAVQGIDPTVEPADDSQQALDIAEEVRQIVRGAGFSDLIEGSLDGLGKGYGIVQQDWETSAKQWIPKGWQWRDPRYFAINRDDGKELRLLTDAEPIWGEPLVPYRWVQHTPRIKMGLPVRGALARPAVICYMLKSFALGDWMTFAEVFGMPVRIGKYHSGATPAEKATLKRAVANIGTDASAIMSEQMKIELLERSKSAGGETLYKSLCEFLDKQVSKLVLGQTMTAEDGASQSQAQVHNDVRMDICRADARQLETTINRDLVTPFVMLNYGAQASLPKVTWPIAEPEDLDALTKGLDVLVPLGLKVSASQVREKFALRAPQADEEILQASAPVSPTAPPAEPVQSAPVKTALNRQQPTLTSETELSHLQGTMLDDWQPAMSGMLDPVQRLLDECNSLEEFQQRLPELHDTMDATEIVATLSSNLFKARALGDHSDD